MICDNPLALAVVISLFASYLVAMTVIPLFCAHFLKSVPHAAEHNAAQTDYEVGASHPTHGSWWDRFNTGFNRMLNGLLDL